MNDSNGDEKRVHRKRRVNPALLLGDTDSQPVLADVSDFKDVGVSKRGVNNFRSGELGQGGKVSVVDGIETVDVSDGDDVGVPAFLAADDEPNVEGAAALQQVDVPSVKGEGGFPVVPAPKGKGSVRKDVISDGGSSVGKSVKSVEPVKGDVGSKVDGRKVNPMFLVGEEREVVPAHVKKPASARPSFMLDSDKVPSRRPVDFSKNKTVVEKKLGKPAFDVAVDDEVEGEVVQPFVSKVDSKVRSQYSRKVDSSIDVGDWSADDDSATQYGLGGELDAGYVEPQYSKGFHLTERDIIIMRFLARYRYAYVDQIARLVDSMPRTIVARMRVLEKRGFLRKEAITDKQYLWTTRKAGNLLADISFPEIKKGTISFATIAHTIGLGNLAVEFEREAGGKDLLGEGKGLEEWVMPMNRWKLGEWGNPDGKVMGEMTVTEREIRQGQMRWRGGRSTKEMRELVTKAANTVDYASELEEGNEGLFVVYGAGGKGGEHIPDLVVARERDENGKPQHIAVELELTPKTNVEWRKILRNYRDNGEMYSKIYYFTHKRSIGNALVRLAEDEGLADRFVVRKYLPTNSKNPFWG